MNLTDARKVVAAFPADHISCDPCSQDDLLATLKLGKCPQCSARVASDDDAHNKDIVYHTCERDPLHFYTRFKDTGLVIPL